MDESYTILTLVAADVRVTNIDHVGATLGTHPVGTTAVTRDAEVSVGALSPPGSNGSLRVGRVIATLGVSTSHVACLNPHATVTRTSTSDGMCHLVTDGVLDPRTLVETNQGFRKADGLTTVGAETEAALCLIELEAPPKPASGEVLRHDLVCQVACLVDVHQDFSTNF
jgi:hypothetical protein